MGNFSAFVLIKFVVCFVSYEQKYYSGPVCSQEASVALIHDPYDLFNSLYLRANQVSTSFTLDFHNIHPKWHKD